ncbi:MAG: 6-carboxytetrahydropterin synthase [Chloroflexota bacterium]
MYTLSVKRDFVAQHFLIGGDWGPENQWHSHHYEVELQLSGTSLDQHNYMVDIVAVEAAFEDIVGRYKDKTLNDLPEFAGNNPSIELFARLICQTFAERISADNIAEMQVRIWENDIAWAAYKMTLS